MKLDQHLAILGKTGSGKTYAAKGIVEGWLCEGRQVCVIDPTSAWWGLRLDPSGKRSAFNVLLLGGDRGDLPLSERSGEAVAKLVTQQLASVVIDTGDMSVGEYTRWFIAFAQTLYATVRNPLHLVIDEAHQFMPQGKVPNPEAGRMLHAGNRLVSGGRSRGLRVTLVTQRPAKLHKDSLTCADALIAMRMLAPQDRAAVKDWIDGAADPVAGKQVLDSLAQLKTGEGWLWAPQQGVLERRTFPRITSYDSSRTLTHGETQPKPKEIDLSAVRAAMEEAVREAEANDPQRLRARIEELERELRAKKQAPDPAAIERAVGAAVSDRDRLWDREVKQFRSALQREIGEALERARFVTPGEPAGVNGQTPVATAARPVASVPRAAAPVAKRPQTAGDATLSAMERALLTALAQRGQAISKSAAILYAGYCPSGDVSAAWGRFAREGWIARAAEGVRITDAGLVALGEFDPLPRGDALREYWMARSSTMEAALLRELFARPGGASKSELIAAAGYRPSGDVSAAWGKFARLGWTTRTANGVRASDYWSE